MAEDEEDDMFGDFNFVSSTNSNQINTDEDDDWGDFMSPKQDPFSNGFSNNSDPLNIGSDQSNTNHVHSGKNSNSNSNSPSAWVKPRGAIPLSIFGDEEDHSSLHQGPELFPSKSFSSNSVDAVKKGSEFGSSASFNDIIVNLYGQKAPNGSISNPIKVEKGFNSDLMNNSFDKVEEIKVENGSNSSLVEENVDFDEDDWDFKVAVPEKSHFGVKNIFDSWMIQGDAPVTPTTTTTIRTPTKPSENNSQESFEGSMFEFSNNAQHDGDLFATSNGNSYDPTIVDNGFHWNGGVSMDNFWNADSFNQPKQIAVENGNSNHLADESFDSDESFGDFEDALEVLNSSSEHKEDLKQASSEMKELPDNTEIQGNGKTSEIVRRALPLLIFSDGKLDSEESVFGQDVFSYKPTTSAKNGINSQVSSSKLSLNDLISNLYSQAENIPAVGSTEHTENGFNSAHEIVLSSDLSTAEDDFHESSWEFKDASAETKADYSSPVVGMGLAQQKISTESKITSFVETNSKLKNGPDENISAVGYTEHAENGFSSTQIGLSSDLSTAEDDFNENSWEFKDASAETKANYSSPVVGLGHGQQKISTESKITSFVETNSKLKNGQDENISADGSTEHAENGFSSTQIGLSFDLSTAEDDFDESSWEFKDASAEMKADYSSPVVSLGHVQRNISTELKITSFVDTDSILKEEAGSSRGLFNCITAWSRMISACALELKHGLSIWKRALQKNVHKQISSKSQGQQYILALGEIYRVVEVLRLSATIYKPSIMSSLAEPIDIFTSLEDCNAIWANSGLQEALQSLTDPVCIDYDGSAEELLASIKSIHDLIDLGVPSPTNDDSLPEQTCKLSLLSFKIVPGMKTVLWNGEQYFLTLANFWANLVSCDPPNLLHIPVYSNKNYTGVAS